MPAAITFESVRFGTVEVAEQQVLEFPFGLIGLGGLRYALLDRNPGTGFYWLHSVEDPALALPIVRPHQFFPDYAYDMDEDDHQRTGIPDGATVDLYVTVRATSQEATANLKAPIVVWEGRGFQVINGSEHALLQAPLFRLESEPRPAKAPHVGAQAGAAGAA
jgi:flagellar assembly factor FliW